jgi:hypothetical protein
MRSGYSFKNLSTDWPLGGYAARAASVTLVSRRNVPLSLSTGRTRRFDKLRVIAVEARTSTTVALTGTYSVQWLTESRPPSVSWSRPSPPQSNQPPLDFTDHESDHVEAAVPNDRGVRVTMVKARWAARQRPGLPDAQEWGTALALAVIQTLLGQRPVAHPNRSKGALAGTANPLSPRSTSSASRTRSAMCTPQLGAQRTWDIIQGNMQRRRLMMPPHPVLAQLAWEVLTTSNR